MEQSEIYTETIMNMILDAIDDIIILHDSAHTVIWMNRAGEKAFGKSVDEVIGMKCYELFGNTTRQARAGGPAPPPGLPGRLPDATLIKVTGDSRRMTFEIADYLMVMAVGAIYFIVLGLLNLKKSDSE